MNKPNGQAVYIFDKLWRTFWTIAIIGVVLFTLAMVWQLNKDANRTDPQSTSYLPDSPRWIPDIHTIGQRCPSWTHKNTDIMWVECDEECPR